MLNPPRCDRPVTKEFERAWSDIPRIDAGLGSRELAASSDVDSSAGRPVHSCFPVTAKSAIRANQFSGDCPGWFGAEHPEPGLDAATLIPPGQEKAGIVGVVVKVMMCEEQEVHLSRHQSRHGELVRSRWAAINHHAPIPDAEQTRASERNRRWGGGSGTQKGDLDAVAHDVLGFNGEFLAAFFPVPRPEIKCSIS